MTELIDMVASWRTLLLAVAVFGFAPGFTLRLLVKIYPRDDPRRQELVAELYSRKRIERPLWVAEQLETVLFEGLPHRVVALRRQARDAASANWIRRLGLARRTRDLKRRRRIIDQLRQQMTIWMPNDRTLRTLPWAHQVTPIRRVMAELAGVSRVALVGEPGTGKTTIAMTVMHQILDRLGGNSLLPVWVSLSRWDPRTTTLRDFMASQIALRWNVPIEIAGELVDSDQRLFPILDGLDELPGELVQAATRAIGREWPNRPMLMTTRWPSSADPAHIIPHVAVVKVDYP
ncbi:MAG: NACHT domain-containing protein [Pseudonocardiaceae bacterium]